jgi:PhzF family phenazine biosynthesis protein
MAAKVQICKMNKGSQCMGLIIYQVDAFTDSVFKGNPAAVCLLEERRSVVWMQALAAEMNLSETAIIERREEGNAFNLRWFTPAVEVDLCGHATLAAAHVLWQDGVATREQTIHFYTRSGLLKADINAGLISLDFPIDRVREVEAPPLLAAALGVEIKYIGKGCHDYLIEVASEQTVRDLKPDFTQLASIGGRGFIITESGGNGRLDFVSRFFAPNVGVNEDPVTGSAHCTLADYWQTRLDKQRFTAYQASQRGGVVDVEIAGERVVLSGQAVMVMKGELYA